MNAEGHEVLARAILKVWGLDWMDPPRDLRAKVKQKEKLLHDAWLSHVGHKRPGVKPGLPIDVAVERARRMEQEIQAAR